MDEYAASYSQMENIVNAAQRIKECLVCRICLEFFKEPITIRCGHKFCRSCILRIANNEHATCPFCNIKIQKRSIPKAGNELFELCVKRFNALAEAINLDSGIDVLQPCNKAKHTKESLPHNDRPNSSKIEEASTTSKGSGNSKVKSQNNKKFIQKKKQADRGTKTPSGNKNTLHRYLSSKPDYVSDQEVHSEEKVKIWLKNVTPNADSNHEDVSPSAVKSKEEKNIKSSFNPLKENSENSLPKSYPGTVESSVISTEHTSQKNELRYKETQMRIQEAEIMMAKKKKSSQSLSDKAILKTPSSVPAASHSDAYDWRRVKRVGKEMQVKTFKSLNVSKEKSSSSIVLDDTVPCNSTNNDSKNISRDSDSNNYSSNNVPIATDVKEKKTRINNSFQQKESPKNTFQNYSYKHRSMDSSGSHKEENTSLLCLDPKQVDEIIGILPAQDNINTPERARNISNLGSASKSNCPSPLKVNTINDENELSGEESSNFDSKSTVINLLNSPSKRRLSLKMKLTTSSSSKSICSQLSTPDKVCQTENESPGMPTPDRPKSRLSLRRLPIIKTAEHTLSQKKSPVCSHIDNNRSSQSSNHTLIIFKKLGKICKKRKHIPFLQLGRMRPKQRLTSSSPNKQRIGIVVKSNVPTNIDYKSLINNANSKINSNTLETVQVNEEIKMLSPEKDSQLKYLSIESPHHQHNMSAKINVSEKETNKSICKSITSCVPMEIDETLPIESKISSRQSNFQEVYKDNKPNKNNKNIDTKMGNVQPEPSTSTFKKKIEDVQTIVTEYTENQTHSSTSIDKKVIEDVETNITDLDKSSRTSSDMIKSHNIHIIFDSGSSADIKKCKKDDNSDILENDVKCPIQTKIPKVHEDAISLSSNESESRNTESHSTCRTVDEENNGIGRISKNRNSEAENITDSESSIIYEPKHQEKFDEKKSVSTSRSSSPFKKSPLKKKRTHSESSNDDDVSSIIGKWCDTMPEEPIVKKPKVVSNVKKDSNQSRNASKLLEDFHSDNSDYTLVENALNQSEFSKPQRDPLIDDIITKVKSFKEMEASTSKLTGMPSSLQSADLFESNEHCTRPRVQTPKKFNEITSDNSIVSTWNPIKKRNKENLSENQNLSETTMIDLVQFNIQKSIMSDRSDSSNKENNARNKIHANTTPVKINNSEDRVDEIESSQNEKCKVAKNHTVGSQLDSYHVSDSLLNITQEQLAMKKIENDLIGADLSTINNKENKEIYDSNKFATPRRKSVNSHFSNNISDDFDSDNIGATPVAKRRQIFNFPTKSATNAEINTSDICSPEKSSKLIPAVTPMRNRKSYPLCHSTPMINTPSPENKSSTRTKTITLICSGLKPENTKVVQNFAKKFNSNFQTSFNNDVTHVIVQTDPATKAGQKTFKYMQGIAFKKHVISFQWIVDCLKQNTLLDEGVDKYEVLDPDVFEAGSKRSRARTRGIFEGYAFYCLEPFNSFLLREFKDLLNYNGATITSTIKELSLQKDKFKIVILESENLSPKKLSMLKQSGGALVSFEWIVDSISQYQILSLTSYLCETTVEEALALGFPSELLADEEEDDSQ